MTARVLSCGVFEREIASLEPGLRSRIEPRFLDSMLHMRPALLDERLGTALAVEAGRPAILVYGDCCPHMRELVASLGLTRTEGINCVEIALGSRRFKELRKEGAFFFMPEWLARWREIFALELGFKDPGLAREFMQESATVLVYVDTGCVEIPADELEELGRYFGIPVRVERAGLRGLESALRGSLEELENGR